MEVKGRGLRGKGERGGKGGERLQETREHGSEYTEQEVQDSYVISQPNNLGEVRVPVCVCVCACVLVSQPWHYQLAAGLALSSRKRQHVNKQQKTLCFAENSHRLNVW